MTRTKRDDRESPLAPPHRRSPDRVSEIIGSLEMRHAAAEPGRAKPKALLSLQQRAGNHALQRIVALQRTEAEAKAVAKQVYANNGAAPRGYEGGRPFGNFQRKLPQSGRGGRLRYWEYDVHPLPTRKDRAQGVTRDAERVVIDNNWVAWYTADHYKTFKKIGY